MTFTVDANEFLHKQMNEFIRNKIISLHFVISNFKFKFEFKFYNLKFNFNFIILISWFVNLIQFYRVSSYS